MVVETTDGTLAAVLRYLSARRACVRTASHSAQRGQCGHGRNKQEPSRWFGNCRNLGETHVVEARPQRKQRGQTSGAANCSSRKFHGPGESITSTHLPNNVKQPLRPFRPFPVRELTMR